MFQAFYRSHKSNPVEQRLSMGRRSAFGRNNFVQNRHRLKQHYTKVLKKHTLHRLGKIVPEWPLLRDPLLADTVLLKTCTGLMQIT